MALENRVRGIPRTHNTIYPIAIPSANVRTDLDVLLLELPPRYMPMMPNGIGYVHNILSKSPHSTQTLDFNIILYHRYHSSRLTPRKSAVTIEPAQPGAPSLPMTDDPWDTLNIEEWSNPGVIEYFWPHLEELVDEICAKQPRTVGLSVHGSNRAVASRFVQTLRARSPATTIVIGGYDCVYASVGPRLFPDFDYMVIGEAELSLPVLIAALTKGDRPRDLPGIISRFDSPTRTWQDAPVLQDIDSIGFPQYEWTDLGLYRTYFDKHLVPITASRGCRWGKCRFCAECFPFRRRSPEKVVDEIEFMVAKGFEVFHFNESDVNGDPENLYSICSEIIRRRLEIQMIGQLRIDRRSTTKYFNHLAKAGFKHLRFGVDGWSEHTLRLQRKGYKMDHVYQNLRDCHLAGIYTTVNMVIGVPGETEEDVTQMIRHVTNLRDHIDAVESINTLILAAGSDYYQNPAKHAIKFRGDKDGIYAEHPYYVPSNLWYSEAPYIDDEIRLQRLERICASLRQSGVNIGAFSSAVISRLREKDPLPDQCVGKVV